MSRSHPRRSLLYLGVLVIPARGGTPLKLDLSIPKLEFIALHPDNHRFAFSVNEGSRRELWVLENLLPAPKPAK